MSQDGKGRIPEAAPPSGPRARSKQIVAVPNGGIQLCYWILSERVYGVNYHWSNGRSRICTDATQRCPVDHNLTPPQWQGWLAVQSKHSRALLFLGVSAGGREGCLALQDRKTSLRGKEIIVWRPGNNPRGEMRCAVQDVLATPTLLRPMPDLAAWLERLYMLEPGRLEKESAEETVDLKALAAVEASRQKGGVN